VSIRVALAEDTFIVREGIEQVLAAAEEIEVVASCGDMPTLLEAVEQQAPDVVLTDIRMPPGDNDEGLQIAARLRESHPGIGVVVLSQYADPGFALRLLDSGSDGRAYLLKERVSDRSQLVSAVEAVAGGGSFIDPKVVEALVAARARAENSPLSEMTPREMEVLRLVAGGKSNAAIADELVLTKRAVEKHINAIFLKLGLTYAADSEGIAKRVRATLIFLAESGNDQ
jgi:DNA-binding NarL/FixJ family response regulator